MRYLITLVLVLIFGAVTNALIDGHRALRSTSPRCLTDNSLCLMPPGSNTTTYLEYRGDGTVWALWPDGRFIQVVPK